MSIPRTEDPATTPTENRAVYPCAIISGVATRVNTAADAMDDPVIAAKTAFAATVAIPSPPRTRRNAQRATWNVSRPTSDALTSKPISTKSGTTPKK